MSNDTPIFVPYGRKSSRENPAVSHDRQQHAWEDWADRNDAQLAPEIWERGVSGSKNWRDRGLGLALAACERGEADGIIVEEQNRLSRENGLATAEMWDAFQKANVRLVCVAEGLDTANGDHELNFTMRAALAREQWKQYKRRSDHSKRNAIARGVHISGRVPTGYLRPKVEHGPAKPLEVDARTAPAVREAFHRRAAGATILEVARALDGLYPGGPSGNGSWTKQTVARLLGNRVYIGEARQGELVKPDAHPPLVDERTFATVQALGRRAEPRNASQTSVTLLPDLVRCEGCGYAMVRTTVARGAWVYRCRGKSAAGACESRATIMQPTLDNFVWDEVLDHYDAADEVGSHATARAELVELDATIAETRTMLEPFRNPRYVASIGGVEAAQPAVDEINAELGELELRRVELREQAAGEHDVDVASMRALAEDLPLEDRRQLIARVVDAVVVSPAARRGSNRAPVGERVVIRWRRDGAPFARPGRHRPVVAAGVAAA
jgi:DNA invertase Pin-like site-specific DNA recombinase